MTRTLGSAHPPMVPSSRGEEKFVSPWCLTFTVPVPILAVVAIVTHPCMFRSLQSILRTRSSFESVKALETDEAAARALEQLVLYVRGFDPAHADQEILYPVEVCPPEFVDGHLRYHQIRRPVWGRFD
eukprot:scaffold389258_cov55-Attheya_sp.AAC.1